MTAGADMKQLLGDIIGERFSERFRRIVEEARENGDRLPFAKITSDLKTYYGVEVSPQHLSRFMLGQSSNPTFALVASLADYFSVPVDYFTTEDEGKIAQAHARSQKATHQRVMEQAAEARREMTDALLALDDEAFASVRQFIEAWQQVARRR
ncbi:hypothetical protein AB1207_24070 [Kineococcus endophyticus]|uniref:HTH cro/C1-type domain-containing protein n=1 Tax=Kineococcus endophyticus TaxID=1181883 RepID=A0ABV3PDV9_9ACTN